MGSTFVKDAVAAVAKVGDALVSIGKPSYGVSKLTIASVGSYKDKVEVTLDKLNFFYGLNGTGKTTIARYLANPTNLEFSQCKIDFTTPQRPPVFVVYDEDFIQKNFRANPQQPGIFTLDKDNAEAAQAIDNAKAKIQELEESKAPHLQLIKNERNAAFNEKEALKNLVWKSQDQYLKTPLEDCMKGARAGKEAFLSKLELTQPYKFPNEEGDTESKAFKAEKGLQALMLEREKLTTSGAQKVFPYKKLSDDLSPYESKLILQEVIVGSEDGYLRDIVEKLHHSDWVSQGITEYLDHTEECPFCNRTLPTDIREKIKNHLDESYKQRIAELTKLKQNYATALQALGNNLSGYVESDLAKENEKLGVTIQALQATLKNNLELIEKKITKPSEKVGLHPSRELIDAINDIIDAKNREIEEFNAKVENISKSLQDITTRFWSLLRAVHDDAILTNQSLAVQRHESIELEEGKLKAIEDAIRLQDETIKLNQSKTKNIDKAINWINAKLAAFGLEGFELTKVEPLVDKEIFYKITRGKGNQSENVFNSLSEGEKTLITFLYFIQHCLGASNSNEPAKLDNRVVVIDDPISSLSFNLVFDVAVLINELFISRKGSFSQIIILTHHLYFLHELFNLMEYMPSKPTPNECKIYRVTKAGKTQIEEVHRSDIANNYEGHWQVIKEVKAGKVPASSLPNAMRNVLEYYFSFVRKQSSLKEELGRMSKNEDNPKFRAFFRYINREGHSDAINLTDTKDIDVEKFIGYFRSIFENTKFLEHYLAMMGEDTHESTQAKAA